MEEIRMDEEPISGKWVLTPLYKETLNGKIMKWQIGFDGKCLVITHGYADGIIRTTKTEVSVNLSGRNMQHQGLLEARQRYKQKYKEGYTPAGCKNETFSVGMKGLVYEKGKIKEWPVLLQPKLNGIRLLCQKIGNNVTLRSWKNNLYSHLRYIEKEINEFIAYLPYDTTIDGEMYSHGMDFTDITSAVRTVKKEHELLQKIEYWVFDINCQIEPPLPFEKRYEILVNAYGKYIEDNPEIKHIAIVPCVSCYSENELEKYHSAYISEGYEGTMIKKISNGSAVGSKSYTSSLYKQSKCSNILKYKNFIDEETTIIEVFEAKGTEKGAAIFKVMDVRKNHFNVRMKGSIENRKNYFDNKDLLIGKQLTIRYQELSIYGVPRFPVGVDIRDYE